MSKSRNKAALLRWSAALRSGAAADAVRAGQAVIAGDLRRRIPDRKGQIRRLAHAGPRVLVTAAHVSPDRAHGVIYVGLRFARQVRESLATSGNAAVAAMVAALRKGGR